MGGGTSYPIDIPDSGDIGGSWVNVGEFDTREEAIAWVREQFGADENGCICLVSEFGEEGEE